MRKYLYLAAAASSAAIVALPMVPADAVGVTHVLTIRKVGGPAVRPGAVLKAGLVQGTNAVFSLGTGTVKLTCHSGNLASTVTSNPAKPGTATESLTAVHFGKCALSGIQRVTFKSITGKNLPYKVAVSDAKDHPVTVSGRTKTTPLKFTVTVDTGPSTISCSYKSASITGHESNTNSSVGFSNKKFVRAAGSNAACLGPAHFSARFGPVRDTSVTNHPRVFVN